MSGGDILETCAKIDAICFDKTGTLTSGKLIVSDIIPVHDVSMEDVVFYAVCAENGSEHPIAKAVIHHGTFVAST